MGVNCSLIAQVKFKVCIMYDKDLVFDRSCDFLEHYRGVQFLMLLINIITLIL